jgi:4-amino-4-deoxy-L-arabinose transferase-like glycosyltransferase
MAVPRSPDPVSNPGAPGRWAGGPGRLAALVLVLETGLAVRVLAADAVDRYVRRGGNPPVRLCLFPDANLYWELARALRAGGPYETVEFGDIPHFALRTPGYPLVLAACQALFGERTLPVRLVQAVLGTLCVYLVYCLVRQVVGDGRPEWTRGSLSDRSTAAGRLHPGTIPLVAAILAAVHPYAVLLSPLILSEAVFEPLMLTTLLGIAVLWSGPPAGSGLRRDGGLDLLRAVLVPLGTGVAAGAAVLVRPSWALFIPILLLAWVVARRGERRVLAGAGLCLLGGVLALAPWWYRNWQVYGRFVPTALWFGASLYDGLNPRATGASDMPAFLADPAIWPLDEEDQDAELSRRAWAFARADPARVFSLAWIKLGRYWSPWPHAEGFRATALAVASAAVELPVFALMALGLWSRRRDPRAWVLLAGPILYFCALHLLFASSMRYRIPGEVPALGLAAVGVSVVSRRCAVVSERSRESPNGAGSD